MELERGVGGKYEGETKNALKRQIVARMRERDRDRSLGDGKDAADLEETIVFGRIGQ
jgi:hypothetical protein